MGLFSNVLKRVKEGVPQAIEARRSPGFGIGSLTTRPDLEPRGGGFLKRAVRKLKPPKFVGRPVAPPGGIRPLPIRPPSIGGPGGGMITDMRARSPFETIDRGGMVRPLPVGPPPGVGIQPIRSQGPLAGLVQNVNASDFIGQPLVPGSGTPRPQTGLTAAELLELSDEELQGYIPTRFIRTSPGSPTKTFRDSPEEFRNQLQRELDAGPDEKMAAFGPRRYNLVDQSPAPTPRPIGVFDRPQPPISIGGPGGGMASALPVGPSIPFTPPNERPMPINVPGGGGIDYGGGEGPPSPDDPISGGADLAVMVYGPDGTQYSSPGAARRAGVTDFTMSPPGASGLTPPPTPDPAPDPVTTPAPVIPPAPVTPPASTTVAANQPPVAPPAPTQPPATTTDGVGTAPAEPAPTAPPQVPGETPFAAGVTQIQSGMDPLTEQLLFGIGGQGGFIPGAMRAAEKVFYDDQGQPVVIDEQVAGFSPDQLAAMQMQRQSIGMQQPYLDQAAQSYFSGLGALQSGVGESLGTAAQGVEDIARGVGEARGLREAGLRGLVGSLDEARGLTRGATDEFGRRISGVETGSERAARQFARGLGRSQFGLERGVDQFGRRLTDVEGIQRGATGQFGARTAGIAGRGISDVGRFERGLQDPESLLRGSVGGYNQGLTQQFFDPFEDRVVQQTIEDIMEQGAKSDIGARAGDIARGGESAFGSRARLGAGERTEALGRGLAEALGGIRSSGFQRAQQAGLSEFARQKEAERAAASGLSGLAGQRLGASQQLTGMLRGLSGDQLAAQQALASGLGSIAGQRLGAGQSLAEFQRGTAGQQLASQQALQSMLRGTTAERLAAQQNLASTLAGLGTTQQQALSQAGQQALAGQQVLGGARTGLAGMQMGAGEALQRGQFGLGSSLQGLGAQAAGASASDIAALYGMGAQQQGQAQQMLDAQRRNLQQRQMTPLLQYQALAPFISMAPAGQFQTTTQFAPKPSAMQAGLGTGLSAFGALGQLYGGKS